jgi:hypothetical protein
MRLVLVLALLLAPPALAQERVRQTVDVDAQDRDLRDVLAELGRRSGHTIVLDPRVRERVTLTLRQVSWRDAVNLLAERASCEVEALPGGGLLLTRPERLDLELVDAPVQTALLLLARHGDRSIVIGPQVKGTVTLSLRGVSWESAFLAVTQAAGDFVVLGLEERTVRVGGDGGAPLQEDQRVLEGELVRREGDVVRLRLEGGEEVLCRVPAEGQAREAIVRVLEHVLPGDALVVSVVGRPGDAEALTLTSVLRAR